VDGVGETPILERLDRQNAYPTTRRLSSAAGCNEREECQAKNGWGLCAEWGERRGFEEWLNFDGFRRVWTQID
jgi:hypothetical protein